MSLYRAKKLDIGCFVNTMIIRDHTKRKVFEAHETERYALAFLSSPRRPETRQVFVDDMRETDRVGAVVLLYRQALRYIVRNTQLTPRERAEAHIQLAQMHAYMNPTQIRNRCTLGGKGRGVFRDFKMSRVGQMLSASARLLEGQCWSRKRVGYFVRSGVLTKCVWQYNFRMQALAGALPGVQKASW